VTINALAERIRAKTGSKAEVVRVDYKAAYGEGFEDMMRRTPNIAKINGLIGWKPKRDLDTILDDIIAHYRKKLA
jgi:UDP-glucose 4-epimerase